jgi:hypothetical protein
VAPTPAPSGRPTSAPSAAPTLSLTAQWSVRQKDLLEEVSSQITSSSVTYSDVVVIGSGVEMYAQTCSNWNKFYTNVQAAAVSKQLMKLTLAQSLGLNVPTTFFTCDGANPLTTLQDASVNGSVVSVSCGGGTWSVGSCSEHFALCVNCSQADITTCYANSFNSCSGADSNSSCLVRADTISGRYASYARVLIATFAVVVPAIEIVTVTDTKRLSVTLSVELDQYGAAYCAAFALSATPTAIQQITSLGHMAWAADDAVNITVTGLSAVTNYNIYCVAMSKQGQFSDISVAIANRQLVKTPCCKTLSFALITRDVYQDTLMAAVATLSSSSLPTSDLTVSFNAICRSDSKVYVGSILFPMTVTLGLSSPTASAIAFNGASSGKCNISAVLSGTDASDFEIVFTNGCVLRVLGSQSVPATPSISSAQFSSDGSSIVVKFDSQTDKGRVASVNNYICSVLFVFSGASQAKCQWNVDATTVTITLSSNYPLVVGAQISVAANKIRAACPTTHNSSTCERWPSVSSSSVSVVSPSRPTVPTVHITSPSTVGSCDHLSLDIGSSTGSGGRVWTTANVSLTSTKASNISGLTSFLARSSITSSFRLIIPSGLLPKGYSYSFTVTLCNFLGACGSSTASVSVLNLILPVVGILGSPTFSVSANSSLMISSSAYTAACDGSKSFLNLVYVWSIYLLNGSSATPLSLSSVSKDPSKYSLSAYQLSPSSSYSVQLTVTNSLSLKSSSIAVVVMVPISDLIVIVAGGTEQSVRLTHDFVVDASGSFDSDQASRGTAGIYFVWTSYQTSPAYSLASPLRLWDINSSILSGLANETAANTTSVVSLSMYDSARVATAEVALLVLPETSALVRIVSTFANDVQATSTFVLKGSASVFSYSFLSGYGSIKCMWTVDDTSIDLASSSYVPPSQIIAVNAADFATNLYLSLFPNTMPVGSSLVFTLTCAALDSTTGSVVSTSFASIAVSVNAPPTPGACSVSPKSGVELTTSFEMIASYWVDHDTPISYEFGFLSSSTNVSLVVQTKGVNSIATTYLSCGSSSKNYSLTTSFQVFDSLGASVTQFVTIQVVRLDLNATTITSKTAALLAEASGNVDGLKQIISVVANSIGTVNCSQAPNCTALNRLDCLSTPQTCGTCLSDEYVGVSGDSNTACVLVSDYQSIAETVFNSCDSNSDCSAWFVCNSQTRSCMSAPKSCISNCTSATNGVCTFIHSYSLEILVDCTVSNPDCSALCLCTSGYYGQDCSLNEVDMVAMQDTTSQLVISLSNVNDLETLDSQSAVFISNGLLSLTSNSYLLTDAAASIVYNISATMLQDAEAVLASSVTTTFGAVVDNLLGSSYWTSSSSSLTRRRHLSVDSASNSSSIRSILGLLSNAMLDSMLPGQDTQTTVQSNYRLAANVISTSTSMGNVSMETPQTALESLGNTTVSTVTLNDVVSMFGDSAIVSVGVVSVPQYLMDASSYMNLTSSSTGNVSITSNAFQVVLSTTEISSTCSSDGIILSFVHYGAEEFGLVTDMNATNTTCVQGINETVAVYCASNDQVIPVYCNGSLPSHTITTHCPRLQRLPTCVLTTGARQVQCELMNYTEHSTTCRCSSCLFVENSRRRRLQSSASAYGTEILALSEYSFTEYISIMESAASFDSLSALKDTLLILITFAVMWLGMFAMVCGKEYWQWYRSSSRSAHAGATKATTVVPSGSSKSSSKAGASGRRKSSVGALQLESLKYESLEDCLKDYIYELFSPAFSDDSETVRFLRELWNKHEYISIFTQTDFGTEQLIRVFCVLTNLNANFFLLALFYDIQFASDDGTCALLDTEAACMSKISMFNPSQTKCIWMATSSYASSFECVWQSPKFELLTAVIVFVIVLTVSSPITFSISCICEMILMGPVLTELQTQDANNRTRRQSALLMMSGTVGSAKSNDRNGSTQVVASSISANGATDPTSKRRARNSTLFSRVEEMGSSIKKVSSTAHRLSHRQMGTNFTAAGDTSPSSPKYSDRSVNHNYKSFVVLSKELRKFAVTLEEQHWAEQQKRRVEGNASTAAAATATYSGAGIYEKFRSHWGLFLEDEDEVMDSGGSDAGREKDSYDDNDVYGAADVRPAREEDDAGNARLQGDRKAAVDKRRGKKKAGQQKFRNGRTSNRRAERVHNRDESDNSDTQSQDGRSNREDLQEANAQAAASAELLKVSQEAHTWVKKLKRQTNEQIGVQILELFVRDCLGQHSRQSTIFSQKIRPFEERFALTWSIKGLTFLALCILNIYFVFACMLYGKDKGLAWQRGWLFTCIVNICVDVFINAVTVAAVMHFFVPNLIVDKARSIKQIVTNIIHDLCTVSGSNMQDGPMSSAGNASSPRTASSNVDHMMRAFSAADYFFVSAHVARAFPELLESRIVLAYKSLFLSVEQMSMINPNLAKAQESQQPLSHHKHRRTRTNSQFIDGTARPLSGLKKMLAAVSLWTTTLLLVFGSQSLLGQEFLINMFNPGLVAAIAYLGLAIWNNSYFGMLVAVFLVVGGFSVVYWAMHRVLQRRSKAKDWLLQQSDGIVSRQKSLRSVLPITTPVRVTDNNVDEAPAIPLHENRHQGADGEALSQPPHPVCHRSAFILGSGWGAGSSGLVDDGGFLAELGAMLPHLLQREAWHHDGDHELEGSDHHIDDISDDESGNCGGGGSDENGSFSEYNSDVDSSYHSECEDKHSDGRESDGDKEAHSGEDQYGSEEVGDDSIVIDADAIELAANSPFGPNQKSELVG